jgi:hypothetical protein
LVIFHHSVNDLRNNMTLHRMRRPFGKGVFALDSDGQLVQKGVPVPQYPLCSAVAMNTRFEVEKIDTPTARAACAIELNLSDHSAFFTYVTQVLRRSPEIIQWLHDFGSHTKKMAKTTLGVLLPGTAHAVSPHDEASRRLTSALILAMERGVRADGADFLLWMSNGGQRALGPYGLEGSGVDRIHVEVVVPKYRAFPTRFKNDSHWNALGNRLRAEDLARRLITRIQSYRARHRSGG